MLDLFIDIFQNLCYDKDMVESMCMHTRTTDRRLYKAASAIISKEDIR